MQLIINLSKIIWLKRLKKEDINVVYSDNSELKIAKENNENDNNDKLN